MLPLLLLLLLPPPTPALTSSPCTSLVLSSPRPYVEVVDSPSSLLSPVLECQVCRPARDQQHHTVSWQKEGRTLDTSSHQYHGYSLDSDQHLLKLRRSSARPFSSLVGNYTCSTGTLRARVEVGTQPPAPTFLAATSPPGPANRTSWLLTWHASSLLPIIQHLLTFRRAPLSGQGEDWVSLVIPHHGHNQQSYLLRGLTEGTTYQARLVTRTRAGLSHFSLVQHFTTWSLWPVEPRPVFTTQMPAVQQRQGAREEPREGGRAAKIGGTNTPQQLDLYSPGPVPAGLAIEWEFCPTHSKTG